MKFKKQVCLDLESGEDVPEFTIVDEGEYVQNGKCQYRQIIFSHNDKLYSLHSDRQGSYHTDWYYGSEYWSDEVECPEVELLTKTISVYGIKEKK